MQRRGIGQLEDLMESCRSVIAKLSEELGSIAPLLGHVLAPPPSTKRGAI